MRKNSLSLRSAGLLSRLFMASACFSLLLVISGCTFSDSDTGGKSEGASESGSKTSLEWVATTGHVHDALTAISAGTNVNIKLFCGPGIDPHSFSASTNDVQAMSEADAIFYNGFHLEAKLHDLLHHQFADKAFAMADHFPESSRLDWVEDGEIDPEAPFDPHIWNHLPGWMTCVEALIEHLCAIDAANAELYRKNGEGYLKTIESTHQAAIEKFDTIPESQKLLVSAHDAFNYFAKVYHFESFAVLGVGNDAEADIKTMRDVAATVSERKIPVIFIENITNPKVTEALQEACEAKGWSVKIAEEPLYSDALGSEPPVDSFMGVFQHNVDLITESLKPEATESEQ